MKHITTRNELDRWEQEHIQEAYAWLERKRKKDILTEEFICILPTKMFGKVWNWAGKFRKSDKNMGVAFTQVRIKLRQLLDSTKFCIEHDTFPPDEIAYRFHHKLVWIHWFPNGNGRHSRLMTDIILEEVLGVKSFFWGSETLSNALDIRNQ